MENKHIRLFRGTSVQEAEAGGITAKDFIYPYPINQIQTACPLITKSGIKFKSPWFFIYRHTRACSIHKFKEKRRKFSRFSNFSN